jgi:hypothetical protein
MVAFWSHVLVTAESVGESSGGLPFCDRHRSYFVRRARFVVGGWIFLLVSMSIGLSGSKPGSISFVAFAWLFVFLPAFLVVHLTSTRATETTEGSVTLAGASREFASAVDAKMSA